VAEVKVVDEPVTVVVSLKGWVRALKGHEIDPAGWPSRPATALYGTFACRSVDTLLVFGSNGRVYSVAGGAAARRARRRRADHHLIDLESRHAAAHYWAGAPETRRCCWPTPAASACWPSVGDMQGRNKGGKAFLTLETATSCCRRWRWLPATAGGLPGAGRPAAGVRLDELKLQPNGGKRPDADGAGAQGAQGAGGLVKALRLQ
jgi:topoisomerase-4 subunit A